MIEKLTNDAAVNDVVKKRFRVILEEGAKVPVDFNWIEPELPPYYDEKKFQIGQRAFSNNFFSMLIGKLVGLLSLYSIKSILDVIMYTKQSNTPCRAYRRYTLTIFHVLVWLQKNPKKSEEFLKSLKIVRKKHCVAFKKSTEAGILWPTQLDMCLTQFGFIGYILISSEHLGIKVTREEMEGLVHIWRVIGSILGIEERFNLCSGTFEEARALCQKILDEVFIPAMINKNEHFDSMTRVLLESFNTISPSIEPEAFKMFTYYLMSISASNNHAIVIDTSNMSFYNWYLFSLQCFVLKYLLRPTAWWSSFFRAMYNSLLRLSFFIAEKHPHIATWKYGIKYSKVNIFNYKID